MAIPVIDLFAGPGGLGEGFSSISDNEGKRVFKIKLSIEKDQDAVETLRLRSFYRQFAKEEVPELYYLYIKENNKKQKNVIFNKLKNEFSQEWQNAENEAWHFELPYPEEIDEKTKKKKGYTQNEIELRHIEIDNRIHTQLDGDKNWLLIGGPPCQAYSLVGRSRNQGISEEDHRVFLYKEYLRIIAKHNPAVFVMENVKGLLSAKIAKKKIFELIIKDLKNPELVFPELKSNGYKIYSLVKNPDAFDKFGFPIYKNDTDFLIRAENYGVPQNRHRVILLGIREDIQTAEIGVLSSKEKTTLGDVIGQFPAIRSGVGREIIGTNEKGKHIYKKIENTFKNWENIILEYLNKFDTDLSNKFDKNSDKKTNYQGTNFLQVQLDERGNPLYEWYNDVKLGGLLNHESRTHIKEDLGRYLFSTLFLEAKGDFPKLRDYPEWLLPKHKNAKTDKFADRFRTQKPDTPATTVTCHISKDGHYFIHYDPYQCRSLTVREAARIQTFPDNYYFCGNRTQQYHQVGNAVPPYLAKQIGDLILPIFKNRTNA